MRRTAALAVSALLLAGCGSTVQSTQGSVPAGDALAAPNTGSSSASGTLPPGLTSPASGLSGAGVGVGSSTLSSTTAGSAPGASSSTAPVTGTSTTTVSAHGPIKIGFIVTNVSNAGDFGISTGQTYSDQQLYEALVAAMNKRGGIDGHKIVPVYGVTDTSAPDWSTQFQAACAKFTQDNHVAAVLGYIFVFMDSFESCLARAGVPHLYGGYQPGDETQQQKYPSLVSTTAPTSDVHWQIGLGGAVESGLVTTRSKLGVVVDSCANDDKAFARVGAPYLKAHHINYETFVIGCSAGASDNGAAVSQVQSAELRFRAHGDDTVFVEGVPALLFAEDAESQNWRPAYLMTMAGAAFEGNVPTDQLSNFHGFGAIPSVDVDPKHQPYKWNASEQRCLDMLAAEGLHPKGYNDYFEAFTTCDGLFLYAAALSADGGQTATGPVVSALSSVIGKTLLSSTYGGVGRYVPSQHGGPGQWRQWGWSTSCGCFKYLGSTHRIG